MRVLQVEDDDTTAKAVERMLRSKGYTCQSTALGREAIELAQNNEFDLILLDIALPDMDGYEVLRRLQSADVKTPVVIQSGLVDQSTANMEPGFGVKDYLVKPFTKKQLNERIESALDGPEPEAPPAAPAKTDDADDADIDPASRRQFTRVRTLKSAQIIYRNSNCVIDCLILNMSDGGAAVQPADFVELPETFLLKVHHGPTYRCQVRWRHGNKIGIRFLD